MTVALQSEAFHRAEITSETYRTTGLLCLLAALAIFVIVRGIVIGDFLLLALQFAFLAVVIAHEVRMLRALKRALRNEGQIAPDKWVINVVLESQIPTVALLLLLTGPWLDPHQVLVAPAVLVYFLLIILSTLRLNPGLIVLTGLLSAVGYLFVTFYASAKLQSSDSLSLTVYFIYAGLILAAGILAAVVASRIRIHVQAALREAELRSEEHTSELQSR